MRRSWTPSIVSNSHDRNVYLVVDDLGLTGRVYRETDVEATDLETVILDLLEGQYNRLQYVRGLVAGRFGGHRARASPSLRSLRDAPSSTQDFVERHDGLDRQLTLQLA